MDGLPGLGSSPLDIVVRTVVIYVAVVAGLRVGGKREVGQLGTLDLVALLLIANAVQNAMVGTDSSLGGGLLAGGVILAATRGLDMVARRSRLVRRLVIGESRVLIANGHINRRAMVQEQISDDELQEALHEHGLEYRREVKRATLEVDGSISIIPQPEAADRFQGGGGPDTGSRRGGRIRRHSTRHMRHDEMPDGVESDYAEADATADGDADAADADAADSRAADAAPAKPAHAAKRGATATPRKRTTPRPATKEKST